MLRYCTLKKNKKQQLMMIEQYILKIEYIKNDIYKEQNVKKYDQMIYDEILRLRVIEKYGHTLKYEFKMDHQQTVIKDINDALNNNEIII